MRARQLTVQKTTTFIILKWDNNFGIEYWVRTTKLSEVHNATIGKSTKYSKRTIFSSVSDLNDEEPLGDRVMKCGISKYVNVYFRKTRTP